MSDVIDTSVVSDEAMIGIRNLTDYPLAYHVTSLGDLRRELPPRGRMRVSAGELRQLNYEMGGSELLRNYICVGNSALAEEFGVSSDTVEYNWTVEDVDKALMTDPIEVLEDAMDFAPDGIKEMIAKRAVELEIPDSNRRKVISDNSQYDIDTMIKNKQAINADADASTEKKAPARRRAASTTTKSRRTTTTKKTETAKAE